MTIQASAFVASYLGPAALVPPSPAAAKRMHDVILHDGIPNVKNAGQMSSPMAVPGTWAWAYCIHHKAITPDEAEPHFALHCQQNLEWRGLGSEDGPHADPPATVVDMQHVTVAQPWLIGALSPNAKTRHLARAQALDLRKLMLADRVCTLGDLSAINQRENGLPWQALLIDYAATGDVEALAGAAAIADRIQKLHGETNGVPFYTTNTPSLTDPRHGNLPNCTWMTGTPLRAAAWMYDRVGSSELRGLVLHGLRCMAHAQTADGRMVDDYGWDAAGEPAFYDDGKETMDAWCDPAIFAARRALDDEWPAWAQAMLDKRKERFLALNRWKPSDSGFKDQKNMGLAIDYAANGWGWRET